MIDSFYEISSTSPSPLFLSSNSGPTQQPLDIDQFSSTGRGYCSSTAGRFRNTKANGLPKINCKCDGSLCSFLAAVFTGSRSPACLLLIFQERSLRKPHRHRQTTTAGFGSLPLPILQQSTASQTPNRKAGNRSLEKKPSASVLWKFVLLAEAISSALRTPRLAPVFLLYNRTVNWHQWYDGRHLILPAHRSCAASRFCRLLVVSIE